MYRELANRGTASASFRCWGRHCLFLTNLQPSVMVD